ncbi:hypothetical protein EMCRGX_G034499 [Ephydatia muelleri]
MYNIPDPPVDEADHAPGAVDEMDPDEEIMRLMSTIDSKGNYKPFKSNVAAMAYLLAHSPRPMDGCEGVFANAQLLESHQDILNCSILGPMHEVSVQDIETILPPLSDFNQAPVMEMAKPLVKQFLALEDGIVLFDALLQCDLCSHMGATSNMFCRICNQ